MFCIKCGFRNEDGARFCGKCGAPLIYDDGFDPDEATHARGDKTYAGGRASAGRRYGDDTYGSSWTAGRQSDDIPESQRPDTDRTYSGRADRNRRYGETESDDFSYTSPTSGKTHKKPAKKKKRTKEREDTSSLRIALACLITLAFVTVAGLMLYRVFSRKDSSPDIAPIQETATSDLKKSSLSGTDSSYQNGSQGNPEGQSEEIETVSEGGQAQAPYMEIYDDEGGVIVVDGQSVPEKTVDSPAASSAEAGMEFDSDAAPEAEVGMTMAIDAASEANFNALPDAVVDMESAERVEQETLKASQQKSAQTAQQTPTTASLLPGQTGPDLSGYQPVNVVNASASSTIVQEKTDNYPMLLFDGRDDSTWQEGVEGYGIGEWVSWNMDRKYNIKYIGFKMGNWASDNYYYGNARPKTIVLTAGDFTGQITFNNERAVQWVELSNEVPADSMRIQINDVFPGTTWADTCITEILVYGK